MKKKICKRLLMGSLLLASFNAFAEPHDVFGTYLLKEEGSKIKIEDCGDGSPCGKIVWLDPKNIEDGKTAEEVTSKAGEPLLGLVIVKDFQRKRNDWRGGTIYHPGRDKTYASRMKKLKNGNVEVKGCISFFCITQIWIKT